MSLSPELAAKDRSLAAAGDAEIFADRSERKYFLRSPHAREFVDGLSKHLEVHRFRGDGFEAGREVRGRIPASRRIYQ